MGTFFEELDYQKTAMGELILRRRRSLSLSDGLVYEVKLNDEMLMSSSVNASERALSRMVFEAWGDRPCDVLVGGLGLGYTAAEALCFDNVRSLVVIEMLAPVIEWHRRRLVPAAAGLMEDPRCSLVEGDFFEYVRRGSTGCDRRFDIILLDIDHSPESWLQERHGDFYSRQGLSSLSARMQPGGLFGLWSASRPEADFLGILEGAFESARTHEVTFFNPHIGEMDSNWIIIAGCAGST